MKESITSFAIYIFFIWFTKSSNAATYQVPSVIRIGGVFTRIDQGQPYQLGQYTLAAFLLALQEINNSPTILKATKLDYAIEECYLSSSIAISNTVDLITQVFNGKGVSAMIGPGLSAEAIASASVATSFQSVQVSNSATSSALSDSTTYPYFARTCPSDIYQARAMASLVCQFGWRNIVTFATSDEYGITGMQSFLEAFSKQCSPNRVLASLTFDASSTNIQSSTLVPLVKLQARIFVLFMSATTASAVINEAFNVGLFFEGVQIVGSDSMMGPAVYQSIPPSQVPVYLKGMLGFVPTVTYTSSVSKSFLTNFRAIPNTILPGGLCSTAVDDNGKYLYLEPASLQNPTNYTCTGLNVSTVLPDGSNLTPFAAYSYDAAYLLAYGLEHLINNRQSITGPNLYDAIVNKVSFRGATGLVKLASTNNTDPLLGPGDRIGDVAYSLLNFQPSVYASNSAGISGFVVVGAWTNSNITAVCTDANSNLINNCQVVFNTASGAPPSDSPPAIYQDPPNQGRLQGMAILMYVWAVLGLALLYTIWTPHFVESFLSELMSFLFLGILVGATRVLLSSLRPTDEICSGIMWTEHFSFWVSFGGLVLKSSKVRHIVSTLNGEDIAISNHQYTRDDAERFYSERWGLLDAPDIQRDQSVLDVSGSTAEESKPLILENTPSSKATDRISNTNSQKNYDAAPTSVSEEKLSDLNSSDEHKTDFMESDVSGVSRKFTIGKSLSERASSVIEHSRDSSRAAFKFESPSQIQRKSFQIPVKIHRLPGTKYSQYVSDSMRSDGDETAGFGQNNREIAELYGLQNFPSWFKALMVKRYDDYMLQKLVLPGFFVLVICMILIQWVGQPFAETVYTYSGAQPYANLICTGRVIAVHDAVLCVEFVFVILGIRYCFQVRYMHGTLETEVKYLFRAVLLIAVLCLTLICITWNYPVTYDTYTEAEYSQLTYVIAILFTIGQIFTLTTVIFIVFQRYWIMSRLPVHNAMAENLQPRLVMQAIFHSPQTMTKKDLDGLTAYDWAMSIAKSNCALSYSYWAIVRTIVEQSLPFDPTDPNLADRDPKSHRYFWNSLVQSDSNCGVVEYVLETFPDKRVSDKLIQSTDRNGRKAIDLASPICKLIMLEATYFLKLYDIESLTHAQYESSTSVVIFAINRQLEDKPVALKFMKYKEQLQAEIDARFLGKFDPYYVVPVLNACRGSVDEFFYQELCKWNLRDFIYYIELDRGSRSLKAIVSKETLDNESIRKCAKELVSAVAHMHSRGYSHNDIRPCNFVRRLDNKQLSIIDLTFTCPLAKDSATNLKFRSYFFTPPESSSSQNKSYAQASESESPYTWSSGYLSPEVAEKNINFDFDRFFGKMELGLGRDPWSMVHSIDIAESSESEKFRRRKKRRNSSTTSIFSNIAAGDRNSNKKLLMAFRDVKMGSRRLLPMDRHYSEAPLLAEIRHRRRLSLRRKQEDEAKSSSLDGASAPVTTGTVTEIMKSDVTEFVTQIKVPVGSPSLDIWAVGAVLYELLVDAPLFLCSKDDNIIHKSDMKLLVEWSDATKAHKLSVVADPVARDMLSQLLEKDPAKRPSLSDILTHEYFKLAEPRSQKWHPISLHADSTPPIYDFYISYRHVDPDDSIVDEIYSALTRAGYKVSLGLRDDPDIAHRMHSESEKCNIVFKKMLQSKTIMPIFSRAGMRNNFYDKYNLELLDCSSPCDMLLFEHKVAVEIQANVESTMIVPIFLGSPVIDAVEETTPLTKELLLGKYLFHNSPDLNDSCYPILKEICIKSIDNQFRRCIDDLGVDDGEIDVMKVHSIDQILSRSSGQPHRFFLEDDVKASVDSIVFEMNKILPPMSVATSH